jgi:ABC-type antimicrobial peptide transport system permease subunit
VTGLVQDLLLVSGFALLALALGAVPGQIMKLVLSQSAWLVGAGVVAGTLGALATTRLLTGLLFEVRPTDPLTFLGTALVLVLVAAGATLVPALRAVRTDPAHALRSE